MLHASDLLAQYFCALKEADSFWLRSAFMTSVLWWLGAIFVFGRVSELGRGSPSGPEILEADMLLVGDLLVD